MTEEERNKYKEKLRERLLHLREAAGVSQAQVGAEIGQTAGNISNLERGDGRINLDTLLAYSSALGKPISRIVDVDNKEVPDSLMEAAKYYLNKMDPTVQAFMIDFMALYVDSRDLKPRLTKDNWDWYDRHVIHAKDWRQFSLKWDEKNKKK